MNEKSIQTSTKQRVIIGIIAVLMLLSTIGVYALIVFSGKGNDTKEADLSVYQEKLQKLEEQLVSAESNMSDKYLNKFKEYRSRVKSYNANNVNTSGINTTDLVEGTGDTVTSEKTYMAYYIGWCANEEVFDSSFDKFEDPTRISPLTHTTDSTFVTGWEEGVEGMKVGGVREIAIPGELAYGETREICGGYNSPLKFLVYVIDEDPNYSALVNEYNQTYNDYVYAYYSSSANASDSAASE